MGAKKQNLFNIRRDGRPRLSERGFTMVEILVAVAILGLIIPTLTLLFTKVSQGFAADEMHTLLKKNNQETMNRLHSRLTASKRVFQNDPSGTAFLGLLNMAGVPATLGGSKLPLAQTGSFSPVTAVSTSFGNSLLFALYDTPQTIVKAGSISVYNAPASLLNVLDSGGNPHNFYLDLYRFYYYYLTPVNPHGLVDVPSYALVEWESIQYADYQQLNNLYFVAGGVTTGNVIMKSNAISILAAKGVTMAFDAAQTAVGSAFYSVSAGPTFTLAAVGTPQILQAQWKNLTYMEGGVLSGGFRYGISANSATWSAPVQVPQFAATVAGTGFPGGFEVGLSGTSAGREVMIRSVLVAKGAAPRVEVNDLVNSTNARDIW